MQPNNNCCGQGPLSAQPSGKDRSILWSAFSSWQKRHGVTCQAQTCIFRLHAAGWATPLVFFENSREFRAKYSIVFNKCQTSEPNTRFFFFCRSLRRYRPEKTHYIILPIKHFSSSKHMPASPMSDHAAARRHDVDAQLVVLARHERRRRIGRPAPKPTPN